METKQKNNRTTGTRKPRNMTSTKGVSKKPTRTSSSRSNRTQEHAVNISADVVYLAPKPFNRNRLFLQLATVAAVVIAFVLGLSVFFKVDIEKITVSGSEKYSAWDIAQASGIEDGTNLLTLNRAGAVGKIKKNLKYVQDARIGIKLPDTVIIVVKEIAVTYAVKSTDGHWWLVSSEGKVVEKVSDDLASHATKILGVQLEKPQEGAQAVAYQPPQTQTDAQGGLIPNTVLADQQLATALDIAGFLEKNRILGEVASIDVNDLDGIQIWYGKQFQVELGDNKDLLIKISKLRASLDQYLDAHDSGILDISDSSKVTYSPF